MYTCPVKTSGMHIKLDTSVVTDAVIDNGTSPSIINVVTLAATVGGVTDDISNPSALGVSNSNIFTRKTAYIGEVM